VGHIGEAPDAGSRLEILERVSEGIVVLDPTLRLEAANRAARSMLGFQSDSLPPRLPSEEVLGLIRRGLEEGDEIEDVITTWFPRRRTLSVRISPLEKGRTLVILEDVTQQVMAQRVRKEFVAHASHELKSPVAGLQALAEALAQAVRDDQESAARFADRMVTESERLGRLVSDLLDLSRLEDLDKVPEDPVDLSAVAQRASEEIAAAAASKKVTLTTEITDGVWIRGDEQQIGLMIRNLLDNAIRYSHEDGNVQLHVGTDDGTAVVRVADDGIGIALEAQGRVFERFYRVDRARSRDRGGTGLGLSIVKHVAESHGGNVSVASRLGEGAAFTARLPLLVESHTGTRSATA
jgi:signal transduction histidine kinase